ncbi:hypothetical protein N8314_00830 [Akkermansiaceae bacterium]|nr:hypothetical protein [Akkermansiaceae bacterium]
MTKVFEVGDRVRRVAEDTLYLVQGEEYEVSSISRDGSSVTLENYGDIYYKTYEFRHAINIKPIPNTVYDEEEILMPHDETNTDEQGLTESLLRTKIGLLEQQVRDLEKELETMNTWWYEEKSKAESLGQLVIKQAAKLVD